VTDQDLANVTATQSIEPLTLNEARNLKSYFDSVNAEVARIATLPADTPINADYCWMHNDQPGGGGWCCVVCREEEREL